MKNLNKINPEERVLLSDSEMKEISGGSFQVNDSCPQMEDFAQCNQVIRCSRNGVPGTCMFMLGAEGGCRCVTKM